MTHHEKIRKELLEQISMMRSGERIPNELHLAEYFGVSRMTVNKVITELAKEGVLNRKRGIGSFVSRKKNIRKVVSILLPCALNISWELQHIISGAAETARKMGVGIELIAVSPDNSKDHIDFSAIEHLSEESLVLVISDWFYRIFPFLRERNCRTLLIDRQLLQFAPQDDAIKDFQILDCNVQKMVQSAFQRLLDSGCKRIAFCGAKPVLQSITCHFYELELERRKMNGLLLALDSGKCRLTDEDLASLKRFNADGLIYDASYIHSLSGVDFRSITNLPETLKCEVVRFNPQMNFIDKKPNSSMIDGFSVGENAVKMLLDPEKPKYKILSPVYFPESELPQSKTHKKSI